MKDKTSSLVISSALLLSLTAPFTALAQKDHKLEVFSWWTSGGEAAALNALFQDYKERDPGVQIVNAAVAGGGGSAARPILQTRLSGGNPPDTWQVHPGWELLGQYVDAGYCEPLNDIYQSEDWLKVLPGKLTEMVSKNGKQWCVLTGVHRGNDLWYNKKVLNKAGIKIGDSLGIDEFLSDCEKLKAAGITPLAIGDSGIWTNAELFENTLAGAVGSAGWEALFSGKMAFDDPKVKKVAQIYAKLIQYEIRIMQLSAGTRGQGHDGRALRFLPNW
ncbi:MAG: carbohydrate ABC transporter substrate-binding protein [Verrucomicrobia bacterium]|nr:carbohydrate ABC transporter substrate-binding protein [Verrucomicrobiota bacterium]